MAPPTTIQTLPTEILLDVFNNIETFRDQSSFVCTSRLFHEELNRELYKAAVARQPPAEKSSDEEPPWFWAAKGNRLSTLKRFFDVGLRINTRNQHLSTLLMDAVQCGCTEVVNWLLDEGADIHAVDIAGRQALHYAISGRTNDELLLLLLKHGPDLEARTKEGLTAMHFAAIYEAPRLMELLLDSGANINVEDHYGSTSLLLAVINNENVECLSLLVRRGASIESIVDRDTWTPLNVALFRSKDTFVAVLMQAADPKLEGLVGVSSVEPLEAIDDGGEKEDILNLLVDHGAEEDE